MDIQDQVLQALKSSGVPLKAGEIAAKTGLDKAAVDKAIKGLKKEQRISSLKVCYYAPA